MSKKSKNGSSKKGAANPHQGHPAKGPQGHDVVPQSVTRTMATVKALVPAWNEWAAGRFVSAQETTEYLAGATTVLMALSDATGSFSATNFTAEEMDQAMDLLEVTLSEELLQPLPDAFMCYLMGESAPSFRAGVNRF